MKATDTSLVVAAFASWHENHGRARPALDGGLRLIEHCALETYSVLRRLPPPDRCPGVVVRDFIRMRFLEPSDTSAAPRNGAVQECCNLDALFASV